MTKHKLYMLNPWKTDGEGPYYCPDCGVVEGFFAYSPQARELVESIAVDYPRPRPAIVEALGSENQSSPVLVLAPETEEIPPSAQRSMSTGAWFIDDAIEICNYLGQCCNGVLPHP
ncbi:MAG: DUF3088 domain-containing protein [Desulfobacterales bacterium]|nr:DUF3088 domain-containing protein [Desulfobacterales bacterium]